MNGDLSVFSPKVDVAIGAVAASSWWWLPHFDNIIHVILGLAGAALVVFRAAIAYRDWRNKPGAK